MYTCVCVRLSVTFVDSVKTNKRIFKNVSPSGSHTILVFQYQTPLRCSDGNPPRLRRMQMGRQKMAILSQILAPSRAVNANCKALSRDEPRHVGNTLTLVAGRRQCLLTAGDDDEVFVTRSLNVTPKTTEQHLIVRI